MSKQPSNLWSAIESGSAFKLSQCSMLAGALCSVLNTRTKIPFANCSSSALVAPAPRGISLESPPPPPLFLLLLLLVLLLLHPFQLLTYQV